MAATITNQDLDNKNTTQGSNTTNQVDPSTQNKSDASSANQDAVSQIAQNYGGQPAQQSDNQAVTQQNSNPSQQKATGYTNIQSIVNANKNNGLANAIGSGIQNVGQQAENDISNQQTAFGQQSAANQANTAANQQLVGNVLNNASAYTGTNATPGASQFQQLLSGVYQGPTGLANSQQIQSEAGDVGQLNKSLSSPGGQQSLLQRFVGKPGYTQGEQGLDTLLLGQGDQSALNAAKGSTAGVQNQANNAVTGAQAQAAQYANQAQQFGQGAQNQLGQYVDQQNNALTQRAQTATTNRANDVTAMQTALNNGTLTPELAQQLGIQAGTNTYNVNAGDYLATNSLGANAQNVANSQQYGNLQALNQLAGNYAPQAASQTLSQFNNPSQAGTFYKAPEYSADQTGYQNALASNQSLYNTDASNEAAALQNLKNSGFNLPANYNPATDASYNGTGSLNYSAGTKAEIDAYEQAKQAAAAQLGGTYTYGR